MFHYITDRDNSNEPAVLDHGKMAKLPLGHPPHDFVDRIGLRARFNLASHHLFNRLVAKLTTAYCASVVGEYAHNIPFR